MNLPQFQPEAASHSYLGNELREFHLRMDLEPGKEYRILLLPLPNTIVFPGETVPLRIHNSGFITKLQSLIERAKNSDPDAVCNIGIVSINSHLGSRCLNQFGVVSEIQSFQLNNLGSSEEIILTVKGKCRFKLLQMQQSYDSLSADIYIMADYIPSFGSKYPSGCNLYPLWLTEIFSARRLARIVFHKFSQVVKGSSSLISWGELNPPSSSNSCINLWHTDRNMPPQFRAEIDPIRFSYYVSANMPVDHNKLNNLLKAENVVERLKLIIDYLDEGFQKQLACINCHHIIAAKSELFNVPGATGIAGAYVNPYGAVHQTITLRRLDRRCRFILEGRPSTQDSWFPGYAWTILYCGRCYNHLGWKFTIAQDPNENPQEDSDSDYSPGDDNDDIYSEEDSNDNDDFYDPRQIDEYQESDEEENNTYDQENTEENALYDETNSQIEIDVSSASESISESEYFDTLEGQNSNETQNHNQSNQSNQPLTSIRSLVNNFFIENDTHPSSNPLNQTSIVSEFWGLRRSALTEIEI